MRPTDEHAPEARARRAEVPSPAADKPVNLPNITRAGDLLKPVTNAIVERRATQHFAPDPVAEEYLDAILTLGAQAPSGFNLQPWRFLVLRDAESRERLARVMPDQSAVAEAPVVIVALGMKEYEAQVAAVLREGVRRGLGALDDLSERTRHVLDQLATVPNDVWVNRHTMVAVAFMMLAAEAYGFDTALAECFDARALRQALGLPDDAEVVALLAIGRREGAEKAYPGRFALDVLANDERWGRPWRASDSPLAPRQSERENE